MLSPQCLPAFSLVWAGGRNTVLDRDPPSLFTNSSARFDLWVPKQPGTRNSIKGAARLMMTAKEFVDFFRPTNKEDFRVKLVFLIPYNFQRCVEKNDQILLGKSCCWRPFICYAKYSFFPRVKRITIFPFSCNFECKDNLKYFLYLRFQRWVWRNEEPG